MRASAYREAPAATPETPLKQEQASVRMRVRSRRLMRSRAGAPRPAAAPALRAGARPGRAAAGARWRRSRCAACGGVRWCGYRCRHARVGRRRRLPCRGRGTGAPRRTAFRPGCFPDGPGVALSLLRARCIATRGRSPQDMLGELRIAQAPAALRTGATAVAAARACGFASAQHFGSVFRCLVGSTPAAWARRQRGGQGGALSAGRNRTARRS